jgi:hypothetical protein
MCKDVPPLVVTDSPTPSNFPPSLSQANLVACISHQFLECLYYKKKIWQHLKVTGLENMIDYLNKWRNKLFHFSSLGHKAPFLKTECFNTTSIKEYILLSIKIKSPHMLLLRG